ncbi:hypothetical protein VaNZ11_007950 [Volvox africanus]|uniref:Ubiquitin-like domain-containing protein n=1 Tax=Volvox africanus TaxID=51714 RepID=A0ABQ5S409_9CHLO|nr:hypothetical protein VaNZ11_007950 [Volvox africanus]
MLMAHLLLGFFCGITFGIAVASYVALYAPVLVDVYVTEYLVWILMGSSVFVLITVLGVTIGRYCSTVSFTQSNHDERALQLFVVLPGSRTLTFSGSTDSTVGQLMDFVSSNSLFTFQPGSVWRLTSSRGDVLSDRDKHLGLCGLHNQYHVQVLGRLLGRSGRLPNKRPASSKRDNISDAWLQKHKFSRCQDPLGQEVYACTQCPFTGRTRSQLYGHMKRCRLSFPEDTNLNMDNENDFNTSDDHNEDHSSSSKDSSGHTSEVLSGDSSGHSQVQEETALSSSLVSALIHVMDDLDPANPNHRQTLEYISAILDNLCQHSYPESEDDEPDAAELGVLSQLGAMDHGQLQLLEPTNPAELLASGSTVEAYKERLDDPLWRVTVNNGDGVVVCQEARITVGQFGYAWLKEKMAGRVRDVVADRQLRFLRDICLPPGNHVPPSLYVLRKMLGIPDPRDFEQHTCLSEKCRFPPLPTKDWMDHRDDTCNCPEKHKRFKMVTTSAGAHPLPNKRYWDFGVENIIQAMFSDPLFRQLRGTGRDNEPDDFYGFQMAKDIDAKTNGQLMQHANSAYDLGFDFAQVYQFKTHSVGLLLMRCTDLPVAHRSKRRFTYILTVIPGPEEPSSMDVYVSRTLDAFKEYGPYSESSLMVMGNDRQLFEHKIFLSAIFADTPANRKLSLWNSHTSATGCGHCLLKGVSGEGGGMYFPGYAVDADVNCIFDGVIPDMENAPLSARCGDPRIMVSHEMHLKRAALAMKDPQWTGIVGCKGLSPIIRELDYCNYNDVFVVPVAHAALFGVIKRFWNTILGKLGRHVMDYTILGPQRKIMAQRASHIITTNDLNRPYRDIVKHRGTWTMEDWLHWLDSYSVYILHEEDSLQSSTPLMPVVQRVVDGITKSFNIKVMWNNLRTALLHYFRYDPSDFSADANNHAARLLKSFSIAAEHVFGIQFCTYNLHILVCRL